MNPASIFKIDVAEHFDQLRQAPIIEAVFEIRSRAEAAWEEATIVQRIKSALPDYPVKHSGRKFQDQIAIGPEGVMPPKRQDLGWLGVRCQSENNLQNVQFNRDAFVFSRLKPYETWERFHEEAFRLWKFHRELAKPTVAQRISLRFINSIPIPDNARLEDFLQTAPQTPRELDLPFGTYLHHDTFVVPGYPYAINRVQTVQHPLRPEESVALILDLDVFTSQPCGVDDATLEKRLAEMRWLKNKMFFGSLTEQFLERLR